MDTTSEFSVLSESSKSCITIVASGTLKMMRSLTLLSSLVRLQTLLDLCYKLARLISCLNGSKILIDIRLAPLSFLLPESYANALRRSQFLCDTQCIGDGEDSVGQAIIGLEVAITGFKAAWGIDDQMNREKEMRFRLVNPLRFFEISQPTMITIMYLSQSLGNASLLHHRMC